MSQLTIMKSLLGTTDASDEVLQFYLDCAKNIICERRYATGVESRFLTVQVQMAIELFNKRGAEGQTAHSENGVSRTYEAADISPSLLERVPYMVRTPFSQIRVI